jgi:protein O-mannosyl-transferase
MEGLKNAVFNLPKSIQYLIVIALCIAANLNTLNNEYALDDVVVLTENNIVKKGVAGIPEIIRTDYFKGYNLTNTKLSAARYRPVSLIVFAIEYQLFGLNPIISHSLNILLYTFLVALLFYLLSNELFSPGSFIPFAAVLLFALHPVHSEVVANVKGRDEILVFIFLALSMVAFLKSRCDKSKLLLIVSSLLFLIALLTKETAITYIGVFPLVLYFFKGESILSSTKSVVSFIISLLVYLIIRYYFIGFSNSNVSDITNSPYVLASGPEAFATKIFVIGKYFLLLLFPFSLTSEYGFNQIPYVNLSSWQFIVSFAILLVLIGWAIKEFSKKSLISFSVFYMLITLSVGTNLFFDFGAPMAERMLFLPSLGFCMLLAYLLKSNVKKFSLMVIAVLILPLYAYCTINRNSEWKNNETLFLADIKKSSQSSRLNLFVSEVYIKRAEREAQLESKQLYLDSALFFVNKSLEIQPNYSYSFLRLGLIMFYQGDAKMAAKNWLRARELDPKNPDCIKWTKELCKWFIEEGKGFEKNGNEQKALEYYDYALKLDSTSVHLILGANEIE